MKYFPELLDRVIARASELDLGRPRTRVEPALLDGLDGDVDMAQIVTEYAVLEDVIARALDHEVTRAVQLRVLRAVHHAIDDEVAAVMDHRTRALRASAEKTTNELRFLADATVALSASLNYDETLDHVACLAVPVLADWCVVDLVEASGEVRRVSVAHRDPEKADHAREWAREFPTTAALARVIETGRPDLVHEISDELLARTAIDARHLEALRGLGLRSYVIVPLIARDRTLGTITLVSASSGRRYSKRDIELATELARRAALAVDNARLYGSARDAVRARDQLLAIVSHDLRNPLGAIGIIVSLLRQRHADEPRTGHQLEIVEQSVERMKRLISDLLDMSSIETGRLSIESSSTAAATLVDDAIATHSIMASERGIELAGDADTTALVCCDRMRIAQVLGNLLSNAIKFCSSGDRISIVVRSEGDRARFVVADTGPGISSEDLPHIFEPFWSAKPHEKVGTGLGLTISKGIIEAHDGEIWAESEPGRGTSVYFTLPLAAHDGA